MEYQIVDRGGQVIATAQSAIAARAIYTSGHGPIISPRTIISPEGFAISYEELSRRCDEEALSRKRA